MSLARIPSLLEQFGTLVVSLVVPTGALVRSGCHLVVYPLGLVVGPLGRLMISTIKSYLVVKAMKAVCYFCVYFWLGVYADAYPKDVAESMCILRLPASSIISYYERLFLPDIIVPPANKACFANTYSSAETNRQLTRKVIGPLRQAGNLGFEPSAKGIILSGDSRYHQEKMAKAIANEANAAFLPIALATIPARWHKRSINVLAAAFSLAQKLEPSVIFIDNWDAVQALEPSLKAELLTLWDAAVSNSRVLVVVSSNVLPLVDSDILLRLDVNHSAPFDPTDTNRPTVMTASALERRLPFL